MPQPMPKVIGQAGAKELMCRLDQLKRDWPSEPELYDLDPRAITALLEYIAAEETLRPRIFWPVLIFLSAAEIFLAGISLYAALMPFGLVLVFFGLLIYDPRTGQRLATYALTQTEDLRVLPALIRGTRFVWGEHYEVHRALTRLLARVTEADAGLLNDNEQWRLWKLAVPQLWNEKLVEAALTLNALQAFALIGNRASLIQMKRVADACNTSVLSQPVFEKALELLPLMEAHLLRQEVPETLLRAADTPTSQPETLLRATHTSSRERPQQLLRASQSEQEETQA